MTKPHEKTWVLEESGVIRIDDATTLTCHIAPWRLPRVPALDDWEMAAKVSKEVTALALALPDMARALLTIAENSTDPTARGVARAELKKAGVLP